MKYLVDLTNKPQVLDNMSVVTIKGVVHKGNILPAYVGYVTQEDNPHLTWLSDIELVWIKRNQVIMEK